MPERSRDWMYQARRDLNASRAAAEEGFFEWACFIAHQAAEKAVKAVYQRLGAEAWGHSVTKLLELLKSRSSSPPEDLLHCAAKLDRLYIPTRYPNGLQEGYPGEFFTEEDAREAIVCAERIIGFCEGLLARS